MLEEEFKKLLEKEWNPDEKELVIRIMDGLLYYKRFLPNNFKDDVLMAIQLCNKLKNELDGLNDELYNNLSKQANNKLIEENSEFNEKNNEINNLIKEISELRNDIEELKAIILIDKKSKKSKKYKFYKKIIKIIFNKLYKDKNESK